MQYIEQEWDFKKVHSGAQFGLPGGIRCKVLDWDLRTGVTPSMLLVKYHLNGADHLMQVHMNTGLPKVGPHLVIFEPVRETIARRKIKYMPKHPGNVGVFYTTDPDDDFIGEIELTITHVPGEEPRLTGARVV